MRVYLAGHHEAIGYRVATLDAALEIVQHMLLP